MLSPTKSNPYEAAFTVAANTNALLAFWDTKLLCKYANGAYLEWFGMEPGNMINKISLPQLLGPLYEKNLPYIRGVLEGKVQIFERDIKKPNGVIGHTIATYSPHFEKGVIAGFFVHVADITALKTKLLTKPDLESKKDFYLPEPSRAFDNIEHTIKSYLFIGFPGITTLARQHFLSATKLKQDFKSKYNTTIFSYFRNLQMELAEQYINQKLYSPKQLAAMFNFSKTGNFQACFQKYLVQKRNRELIETIEKANDERYQTFISQLPFAVAMFDRQMRYLAASLRWVESYDLQDRPFLDKCMYDLFPATAPKWKSIHDECLLGASRKGEEEVVTETGKNMWLKWEVRPWYTSQDNIGGVIIHTEDITALKLEQDQKKRVVDIFFKASALTRIGTWERNLAMGTVRWSSVAKEILEVAPDYEPDRELALYFFKKDATRDFVNTTIHDAIEKGIPFDFEAEITTAKGNSKLLRVIGFPEFSTGKCLSLYGIFHDLGEPK